MNLTIRHLRYIQCVEQSGSVQAASRLLSISQSSILAAIDLAEGEIGARIFDRRPARGATVTPAGERFLLAARPMLLAATEFDRAVGDLGQRVPKVLRIGCFEPFGALFMPDMLRTYVESVGDVEIALLEGDQVQIQAWLGAGLIDLAIVYDIGTIEANGVTPICRVPAHAMLHADDPLAGREAVWLADLAERPLVLLDLPQTATYLMTLFDILAKRPEVRFRTRSYETVRSAVACGFGVSILNMRPVGRATADGKSIVRRPLLDDLPAPTLQVIDMYGAAKPLFVRVCIDVIRQFFRNVGPAGFSVTTPELAPTLLIGQ
ncbi:MULTISPECIES: LysR family transcriptional regulator [unclassified Aureimonas]|uniref:LysR family transcriptional regulator n=1 Tax=unclassified Aureimonas TaxID=2615206 RepID=UPI0006F3CC18|nr:MULTISPECIES: LysR family transcriptional regulator [unclassified Aureimonas]KQT63962.1 transcriptional regulator [Aureimonas sp. Leaf427]KQT81155.1 transcriptional regulator [Aureimonas sp. Leaf460]